MEPFQLCGHKIQLDRSECGQLPAAEFHVIEPQRVDGRQFRDLRAASKFHNICLLL